MYKFVNPPGYQFALGAKELDGEFVVHLTLTGESVNQRFIGEGEQPYRAKREAAIKAKAFLTRSEDGEERRSDILSPLEVSRRQGFLSDRSSLVSPRAILQKNLEEPSNSNLGDLPREKTSLRWGTMVPLLRRCYCLLV